MTHALAANNREQLVAQQQQLAEQLKKLQFQLYDKSSPDVVEHINQLQLQKAKQQGILQQAQQQLAQLNPQLDDFNIGAEQILLEAISKQAWYGFKNKREIVFDSRTGLLFPNFEYVPHVKYEDWEKEQKEYAPSGIGKKKWQLLAFLWSKSYTDIKNFNFPVKNRGKNSGKPVMVFVDYQESRSPKNCSEGYENFCVGDKRWGGWEKFSNWGMNFILPTFQAIDNPYVSPDYPRLTAHEKAKIILDFFIEQDWIPNFEPFLTRNNGEDDDDFHDRLVQAQIECDEYNRIFAAYYQRIQLQKQLVNLEQQITQLPEPQPQNLFTSDFNYRQEMQHYSLVEINNSVWQYSKAAQQWLNYLLTQIDDWANRHQHLLAHALELNNILAKKLPSSKHLTEAEQQFLNARHQQLQQTLNFGLDVPRHALIDLLQQAQGLEQQLNTTTSLTLLAQLEQQARPSFSLLAEHSATLCTQTLKKLEWLENSLAFVQAIVTSEQQTTADYLILLDKYQQDLTQYGKDSSVEPEHIDAWFAEWRQERLQILQQWQPLIQAGLQSVLSEKTVLDTLVCMQDYQQQLDKFYLQNRLGIHTTYAGMPNDNRLEKLGKEQELTKLNHHFMQQLETVIFATETTAQKIWLVRFSDVWQQNIVQEITQFLANQQLIERSDIVQIMSEEMRKLQQQNLASYLQDAKSYSQALAQREQDVNTLVFKMRKALKV